MHGRECRRGMGRPALSIGRPSLSRFLSFTHGQTRRRSQLRSQPTTLPSRSFVTLEREEQEEHTWTPDKIGPKCGRAPATPQLWSSSGRLSLGTNLTLCFHVPYGSQLRFFSPKGPRDTIHRGLPKTGSSTSVAIKKQKGERHCTWIDSCCIDEQ
jgi:hypothetical protein